MKNVEDIYPLSPLQQGLLFHALREPESPAYLNQCSFRLSHLDAALFRQTWERAVARHAALRTAFVWEGLKEPLQAVRQRVELPWLEQDWRLLEPGERSRRLEALRAAERSRPLPLRKAPLMRFVLLRVEEDAFELVWTFHHLLLDGWSTPLLFAEVLAIYRALRERRQPALAPVRPYRDYIAWLQRQELGEAERFWRRYLAGVEAPTPLGLDRPGTAAALSSEELSAALAPAAAAALQSLAARHRLTLNTLALGAWALLLARYCGEEDVVFGSVVAGRPADLPGVESMIGLFINTLPVRVRVAAAERALAWLEQLQAQQLELRQHEHSPLSRVQSWSDLPRGTALFDSILACENYPRDAATSPAGQDGLRVARVRNVELTGFALSATVAPQAGLAVQIAYDPSRFDAVSIGRRVAHLCNLLAGLAAAPGARVEDLPLLGEAERHQLLLEWSAAAAASPEEGSTFPRLFEAQVGRSPGAVAASCAGEALRYDELDARAGRWARLLAGRGVGPDTVVALLAERGLPLLTAILAVLKAGGAYLPLDPRHPAARQRLVVARSGATLVLVQRSLRAEPPRWRADEQPVLDLPAVLEIEELAERAATPLARWCGPHSLAYVIYTSGSTGVPKGAMVEHRGMLNHLRAKIAALSLGAADVVAQSASQCFDISVWQLLAVLLVGGRVELAVDEDAQDPQRLLALVERAKVTILETVPSLLRGVLEMLEVSAARPRLGSLRWLLVTGEAFPAELARRWLALYPGIGMLNAYGPTECSDDVTHQAVWRPPRGGSAHLAIGRPLANFRLDVLDRRLRPVPPGATGELCVGGLGVGRGYLGEPARTAEVFVPDPQGALRGEPGGRLYRTGDLVRHSPQGVLELLGRIDHQVKVRGHRIELGELETALELHPGVRAAVALAREDVPGQVRLVAYVVPAAGPVAAEELRAHLRGRLPEPMLPSALVELAELPLLPSGKLDRKALPAPEREAPAEPSMEPRNPMEETLARIWGEVLRRERPGVHENFFALGGDSILSIQILSRAHRAGLRLTARQVFEHPTIAELAAVAQAVTEAPEEAGAVTGPVPLTPIQCWFFEQNLAHAHHFNHAVLLEVLPEGGESVQAAGLRRTVEHLLAHHDALRMRFEPPVAGRPAWRQVAGGNGEVPYIGIDLSALPEQKWQAALRGAAATLQASLDLRSGSLLRVALFPCAAGRPDHLLIVVHNLVMDGVSWRILLEDLEAVYRQAARRQVPELPPRTASYQRWAERLVGHARSAAIQAQASWWLDRLGRPLPRLPVDGEAGTNLAGSARTVTVALGPEETRALLREVPRAYRTQIQEVLLTALAEALARWTGCRRQLIHLEGHGREDLFEGVDVSRTVGWFTSIFPVLLDLEGVIAPGEALKSVKEQVRAIPDRGIGYGLLRYLAGGPVEASLRARPQPEVLFNYLGQLDAVVAPERGFFRPARESAGDASHPQQVRPHLLEINGSVAGGRLWMAWTYGANRHRRGTVEALADGFVKALRGLIAHCRTAVEQGVESYTPSDFPLPRLDQATLDRVAAAGGAHPAPPALGALADGLANGAEDVDLVSTSESVRGQDGWSEELQAIHLALSPEDLKFRDFARQDPSLRRRSTFHILDDDLRLKYRQQPWPTFVGGAKLGQLKSLSLALANLIRSVPRRIFHNDPAKICEFYRMPSRAAAEIILSEPNCIENSMGRGDLIETADGFKCIEFNFSPNLGGWETSLLAELQGKVPEVASFVEREDIRFSYTSTLQVMFRHVVRQAELLGVCERGEINVACAFSPVDLEEPRLHAAANELQRELDEVCQDAKAPLRGKVVACHYGELVTVQGMLFRGKTQVHAVLELCQDLAPAGVCRCFKAGKLLLFNGPITVLLSDKSNVALLSENQDSSAFSPQEREVIRNHVPWTRRVSAERVRFRGEEVFLPDLLAAERGRLVLKEGRNLGGKGVHLGLFTAQAHWAEAARRALETGGWVVQERLESLPYLYQCGEYGCAPHDVIWGPFVFGDLYGGLTLRMQPKAAGGAVNASLGATEGVALEV